MKRIFLLALSAFLFISANSQKEKIIQKWCTVGDSVKSGSDHDRPNIFKNNQSSRLNDPDGLIIIPVVFHVLYHQNVPEENISGQKIFEQLAILNEDFRKLNADINQIPY